METICMSVNRWMDRKAVYTPLGMLLLLLLSHFSRVRLCVTPQTAAHQAPPSLGFSRQEHWSGLPFLSPMQESEKWKWRCSVVSDFPDPMDCSPPGSSVHGIFQARVLEWGAIAFSEKAQCPPLNSPATFLDSWKCYFTLLLLYTCICVVYVIG